MRTLITGGTRHPSNLPRWGRHAAQHANHWVAAWQAMVSVLLTSSKCNPSQVH